MQFRLTYEGILLGSSRNNTRATHKHEIRKVFHKQLVRLFEQHPSFSSFRESDYSEDDPLFKSVRKDNKARYDLRLTQFERNGYRFFPLATKSSYLVCTVRILFLRPDIPGGIINSGDIDNRMKTIFDALRMPSNKDELGGYSEPSEGENPFFCLLEDDKLINHAEIEADTLLQPTGVNVEVNDSRLIITVGLSPYRITMGNMAFG